MNTIEQQEVDEAKKINIDTVKSKDDIQKQAFKLNSIFEISNILRDQLHRDRKFK
jgi:hypothetical protein